MISCSKVIEISRDHEKLLADIIFCRKLLKVHNKVTASFSFLAARFFKVHDKAYKSCQYIFTSRSSNKFLKVHKVTANCHYLFVAGQSMVIKSSPEVVIIYSSTRRKLFKIHKNVRA